MVTAASGQINFDARFDKVTTALNNIRGQLSTVQGGMEKLSQKSTGVTNSFTKLGAIGKQVFGGLTGVLGIAGLARGLIGAVKEFATFEQTIKNAASVAGYTAAEFDKVSNAAREMSKSSTKSATEIGQGFYYVASAGYTATEQMEAMKGIVALSEATMADMAFTTDIVTATISQFGLQASDATKVADVFTRAITSSQANIQKLGASMRYVGPIAKSMGWSLEETTSILTLLYNAGFKGEQAGTALRGAINALIKPNTDLKNALGNSKEALEKINPVTNSFAEVLITLRDAGIKSSSAMLLFGQEAGPGMASLLDKTTESLTNAKDAMYATGVTAEGVAKKQMNSLQSQLKILNNLWTDFKLEVVGGVVPALKDVIPLMAGLIKQFKLLYDFHRVTEEEATMKRIAVLKREEVMLKNNIEAFKYRGEIQRKYIEDLGETQRELLAAQALLKLQRGEHEANKKAILELADAHVKAWEAAQKKKGGKIVPTGVADPDEVRKALLEQFAIYKKHWSTLEEYGYISTQTYIDNLKSQRENLVIAFGNYSEVILAFDHEILELEKQVNDERLESHDQLMTSSYEQAQEFRDTEVMSTEEHYIAMGESLAMMFQLGIIGWEEYYERLDELRKEHTEREEEDDDKKKDDKEKSYGSLSSLFRKFLADGDKDLLKSTKVWDAAVTDFQGVAVSAFNSIGSTIGDLIVMGGNWADSFKKIAQQIVQAIISIIVQMLILQAIKMAMGISFGSAGGSAGPSSGGGTTSMGFLAKGGIAKGQHGFLLTQGTGWSDNIPALLKPGEVVMPLPYIKDFFGTMGEQLFKNEALAYSGGSTRQGAASFGDINIIVSGVTDLASFKDQYDSIAEELVDTVQKRILSHQ